MSNFSIRSWLKLIGGLSAVMVLLVGGISLINVNRLNAVVGEANAVSTVVRRQMDADMMHDSIRADVLGALLAASEGQADKAADIKASLEEHVARLKKNIAENAAAHTSAAASAQAASIQPVIDRYVASARQIVNESFANPVQAKKGMDAFGKDFDALESAMEKLADAIQARSVEVEADAAATAAANVWQISAALALALLVMTPASLHVTALICKPLESLAKTTRTIQQSGDLTLRAVPTHDNEIGQTIGAFNALMDTLQTIVRDVRSSAASILQSSSALAAMANQTAGAAEQSSESASAMAAVMEELSVSIDNLSAHAKTAADASVSSGKLSRDGEAVVGRAAAEMQEIANAVRDTSASIQTLGASTEQISAIVGVIKEIADQTNLLALNAAIEAARAGEQGRGFAVVADEVRKLAERTTKSTEEISQTIAQIHDGTRRAVAAMESGVARVEQGVELANQAGATIKRVVGSAAHAETAVSEMTNGLQEQSMAGQEIARNVEKVAQVSGQSHQAAQESSRCAEGLAGLAMQLDSAVGRFRA